MTPKNIEHERCLLTGMLLFEPMGTPALPALHVGQLLSSNRNTTSGPVYRNPNPAMAIHVFLFVCLFVTKVSMLAE